MKTMMEKLYEQAIFMTTTPATGNKIFFPASSQPVMLLLYFQPLGISIRGRTFAMTDYYRPGIHLGKIAMNKNGLTIKTALISWVDGKRLFPDTLSSLGANRAQTVNLFDDNTIWFSRNEGKKIFIISLNKRGRWSMVGKTEELWKENQMINACKVLSEKRLIVLRSNFDGKNCCIEEYSIVNKKILRPTKYIKKVADFMNGMDILPGDSELCTITGPESSIKYGIYRGDKNIATGIFGNGIAFLPDGSALVTVYGETVKKPGGLLYLPKQYLKY